MKKIKNILLLILIFAIPSVSFSQSRFGQKKEVEVDIGAKQMTKAEGIAGKIASLFLASIDDYMSYWNFDVVSCDALSVHDGLLELKISKTFNERDYSMLFCTKLVRGLNNLGIKPDTKASFNKTSLQTNASVRQKSLFKKEKEPSYAEKLNTKRLYLSKSLNAKPSVFYLDAFSGNNAYSFFCENIKNNPYVLCVDFQDDAGNILDTYYIGLKALYVLNDYSKSIALRIISDSISFCYNSNCQAKETKVFKVKFKKQHSVSEIKKIGINLEKVDSRLRVDTSW